MKGRHGGLCEEELTLEEGRGSRDWPHHDLWLFLQVSVLLFETQPKKPAPSIRSSNMAQSRTWAWQCAKHSEGNEIPKNEIRH